MKKKFFRAGVGVVVFALSAGALTMFAGCTSNHPEVRITYEFDGETYAVDYTLSRIDAPKTVKHFLELADAGFYDGMCIHDYQANKALYTGGYRFDGNGELEEVDYLTEVKKIESESGKLFTQYVWTKDEKIPLYTVTGEFYENGVETQNSRENRHTQGALVMYYTDKGERTPDVSGNRADNGEEQDYSYSYNSATSLFYTWLTTTTSFTDEKGATKQYSDYYCVFGMAKDYDTQLKNGLLKAITDYIAERSEENDDYSFTEERELTLNSYDYFSEIRTGDVTATFNTPELEPIIVKSVKVTKY